MPRGRRKLTNQEFMQKHGQIINHANKGASDRTIAKAYNLKVSKVRGTLQAASKRAKKSGY